MPDDASYREVRYDLAAGEYLLTIYDGKGKHEVTLSAEWQASVTVKLKSNEICDIEEVI